MVFGSWLSRSSKNCKPFRQEDGDENCSANLNLINKKKSALESVKPVSGMVSACDNLETSRADRDRLSNAPSGLGAKGKAAKVLGLSSDVGSAQARRSSGKERLPDRRYGASSSREMSKKVEDMVLRLVKQMSTEELSSSRLEEESADKSPLVGARSQCGTKDTVDVNVCTNDGRAELVGSSNSAVCNNGGESAQTANSGLGGLSEPSYRQALMQPSTKSESLMRPSIERSQVSPILSKNKSLDRRKVSRQTGKRRYSMHELKKLRAGSLVSSCYTDREVIQEDKHANEFGNPYSLYNNRLRMPEERGLSYTDIIEQEIRERTRRENRDLDCGVAASRKIAFAVDEAVCGLVIGKGGVNVKKLERSLGVEIIVSAKQRPNATKRIVTVIGNNEHALRKAREELEFQQIFIPVLGAYQKRLVAKASQDKFLKWRTDSGCTRVEFENNIENYVALENLPPPQDGSFSSRQVSGSVRDIIQQKKEESNLEHSGFLRLVGTAAAVKKGQRLIENELEMTNNILSAMAQRGVGSCANDNKAVKEKSGILFSESDLTVYNMESNYGRASREKLYRPEPGVKDHWFEYREPSNRARYPGNGLEFGNQTDSRSMIYHLWQQQQELIKHHKSGLWGGRIPDISPDANTERRGAAGLYSVPPGQPGYDLNNLRGVSPTYHPLEKEHNPALSSLKAREVNNDVQKRANYTRKPFKQISEPKNPAEELYVKAMKKIQESRQEEEVKDAAKGLLSD